MSTTTCTGNERCSGIDSAANGDPWSRLRFHYGQLLGAEDFTAEQHAFVLRRRLHLALQHGSGTVWGLKVGQDEETVSMLTVESGLAVDAAGREIYVPTKQCLVGIDALHASELWNRLSPLPRPPSPNGGGTVPGAQDPPRRAYVVLKFQTCETHPIPAITRACATEEEAFTYGRVRDDFVLELVAELPDDPHELVREWIHGTADPEHRGGWHTIRDRLLDFVMNSDGAKQPDLGRFWSALESPCVLLAAVDLEARETAGDTHTFVLAIHNEIRALMAPVQLVAEQLLGQRLIGPDRRLSLKVIGISQITRVVDPRTRGRIVTKLSAAPAPGSVRDEGAVEVFRFHEINGWLPVRSESTVIDGKSIQTLFEEPASSETHYQLVLRGNQRPIVTPKGKPLAGFWDEPVPGEGRGRDVNVVRTWTPPNED